MKDLTHELLCLFQNVQPSRNSEVEQFQRGVSQAIPESQQTNQNDHHDEYEVRLVANSHF